MLLREPAKQSAIWKLDKRSNHWLAGESSVGLEMPIIKFRAS